MEDVGLKLAFSDPETAVAFARELEQAGDREQEFRVALVDPKLNFDAETLILVLKIAGGAATGVAGFLTLAKTILTLIKKPSVKISIDGKEVELHAKASPDDIKSLCDVLIRSRK